MLITDNELLGRYLNKNDVTAFEELVRRHSNLVMDVCRNMLFHSHDAEDIKTSRDQSVARVDANSMHAQVEKGDQALVFRDQDPEAFESMQAKQPISEAIRPIADKEKNINPLQSDQTIADSNSKEAEEKSTQPAIPPAATAIVKPGEVLLVEFGAEPTLNRRVIVREDHTISLPRIGTISVRGSTTRKITNTLEEKFREFIKQPDVFVVRESASTPIKPKNN